MEVEVIPMQLSWGRAAFLSTCQNRGHETASIGKAHMPFFYGESACYTAKAHGGRVANQAFIIIIMFLLYLSGTE